MFTHATVTEQHFHYCVYLLFGARQEVYSGYMKTAACYGQERE